MNIIILWASSVAESCSLQSGHILIIKDRNFWTILNASACSYFAILFHVTFRYKVELLKISFLGLLCSKY